MKLEMKKDVIYRCIGSDFNNGILACGFMTKPTKDHSQYDLVIPYYSWFLLLSGEGFYDSKSTKRIPLYPGCIVQRFPEVCHSTEVVPDGNWLEFFISFGRSSYDYLCGLKLLPLDTPVLKGHFDEITLEHFKQLLNRLKEGKDSDLPLLLLKAQEIVLSVNSSLTKSPARDQKNEFRDNACRMLASDTCKSLSLYEVAASFNMSYETFRKQFQKSTGISPDRYRTGERMKHAKLMLLSGTSIKETAILTGYSDTYSFTRQFTHTAGISPGRYLKENSV